MPHTLTVKLDDDIYDALTQHVAYDDISRFIESLLRQHIPPVDLEAAYAAMAQDEERERAALEWIEAMISDVAEFGTGR